jgi:hypothetical protein
MLKKAVGKTSGRSTDIETDEPIHIDVPVVEGFLEFESAAADVLEIFAQQSQSRSGVDRSTGLHDLLIVDENFSREDERLCAFTRGNKAAIHEQFIESRFHFAGEKSSTLAEKL